MSIGLFIGAQLDWHHIHFSLVAGVLFIATGIATMLWQYSMASVSPATTQQLAIVASHHYPQVTMRYKLAGLVFTLLTFALVLSFW